jgi:hypothetical protein
MHEQQLLPDYLTHGLTQQIKFLMRDTALAVAKGIA